MPTVDPATSELESLIALIEQRLAQLGVALRDRDPRAIEVHSHALHQALAAAVRRCASAAREPGGLPAPLRQRLAAASGQVAAQRESLARATAALDRAIEVLLPDALDGASYGAHGGRQRALHAAVAGA